MSAAIVTYQDGYKTIHGSRQLSVIFRWACSALLVMLSERAKEGQRLPVLVLSPSLRIHLEVTLVVNLAHILLTLVDWHRVQGLLYNNSVSPIFNSPVQQSSDQGSRSEPSTTKLGLQSAIRSYWGVVNKWMWFDWLSLSMLAIVDLEPEGAHLESNIIKPAI